MTAFFSVHFATTPGLSVCYEPLHFDTFKEYKSRFNSVFKMPGNFVSYDMVREPGKFDGLVFIGFPAACGWLEDSDYCYYVVDKTGYEYELTIDVKPFAEDSDIPIIQQVSDKNDLRISGTEESIYFKIGNIRYFGCSLTPRHGSRKNYMDGRWLYVKKKPYQNLVFGEENGGYFPVSSSFLKTRPPVDWISSFGLKPYKN